MGRHFANPLMLYSRFRYTSALQSAFSGGGISSLENLDSNGRPTAVVVLDLVLKSVILQVGSPAHQPTSSWRIMTPKG